MTKGKLIEVLEALELLRVGIIDMQTASATGNEELFNDAFVKMQKLKPSATQAHEKLKAFIEGAPKKSEPTKNINACLYADAIYRRQVVKHLHEGITE